MISFLSLLAALHLAAAVYAQRHLARYVAGERRVRALRTLLIVTGIAVGSLALLYATQPHVAVLAFLSRFGAVHVPAAAILFLKRARSVAKPERKKRDRLAPVSRYARRARYSFFERPAPVEEVEP